MKRSFIRVGTALILLPIGLAGCAPPKTHSAVTPVPQTVEGWASRHESFNKRAQQGDIDLVFIGDSITHAWETVGKEVWDRYYGHRKSVNLGISGDRTQHVLWRLDHGNLAGISPRVAVLMIGTNNSNGIENTAEEIADGIIEIVKLLRSRLPRTKVLVLAIFPRGESPNPQRTKNATASEMAKKIADGRMVHYMDIGEHFLQADGTLTQEIMPDYLHLTPKGYRFWAIAIEGKLRELLGD